jgi:hypothetical protein
MRRKSLAKIKRLLKNRCGYDKQKDLDYYHKTLASNTRIAATITTQTLSVNFNIIFHNSPHVGIAIPSHYVPSRTLLKQPFLPDSIKYDTEIFLCHSWQEDISQSLLIEEIWGYNIVYGKKCLFQKLLREDGIVFREKPDFWNWVKKCR